MSAASLATGQFIAASQALTQSVQAVQSATAIIERCYPTAADLNAPMVARAREDAVAIRALADRLDAALALPSHLREAA